MRLLAQATYPGERSATRPRSARWGVGKARQRGVALLASLESNPQEAPRRSHGRACRGEDRGPEGSLRQIWVVITPFDTFNAQLLHEDQNIEKYIQG